MKKDSLKAILFLIWFVVSIFALLYFSNVNGYYTVMIFGQYFLVFGLVILSTSGKDGLIGIVPFLVGLTCIIIPFLMMHPEIIGYDVNWDIVLPCIVLLAFIAAGIFMVSFSFLRKMYLQKVCTLEIDAEISEKEVVNFSDLFYMFRPKYSYFYNNKYYEVKYLAPKKNDEGNKGTIIRGKIDPNNPERFLYNYPIHYGLIIMGIIFISFASFLLSFII